MIKNTLLILLSIVLLSLNFINVDINEKLQFDQKEEFDPKLSTLNSIDRLEQYIDSTANADKVNKDSVDYIVKITKAIRLRFFHGFSHFTLKQNWIAAVGEKLVGYGLASKVRPDDIMHHANAACSQQAMVMMEILRRKGFSYRSIGFPHHFALEVFVNESWYYFDPNMEPTITVDQRLESYWGQKADNLKQYYDTARFKDLDWKFGKNLNVTHGRINQKYARNARLFQTTTSILSKILWVFPLIPLFYKRRNRQLPRYKKQ